MSSNNHSKKPVGPVSLDDIIAASSPAERLVPVCVAGSLVAEHQELEQELERAQRVDLTGSGRLGQVPTAPAVAKRIEELQQRMRDHTYTFRFRALPPKRFSDLMLEHPDPAEKLRFNQETFEPALIAACCVEPVGMDDPEKVAQLFAALSTAQQSELFEGAWGVNTSAPKELISYAASAVLRNSETNSATPRRSGSRAPSSSAG